jgi:hypothetical protein
MPTAATMPNCRVGWRSLIMFEPKPKTVVPVTMKNATNSWSVAIRVDESMFRLWTALRDSD